jgi:carbohydrate-selective porin OprB
LLTGDAQGFDNLDGPSGQQIAQLFYQQMLDENQIRLKIGRMDSAYDFAYTANGNNFLGASFGTSPAILDFPTYPYPALGAALFWTPSEFFYASGDVSDANRSDRAGVLSGDPYNVQSTTGGVIVMEEVGGEWTLGAQRLAGRLGVGGYENTGTFQPFDGGSQNGANGMYAVFDQTVWQSSTPAGENIGIFGQFGLGTGASVRSINMSAGDSNGQGRFRCNRDPRMFWGSGRAMRISAGMGRLRSLMNWRSRGFINCR